MHNASPESNNASPEIIKIGYDTRDIHISALVKNIVVIWVLIIGTMILMVWMLGYLNARKAREDAALGQANPLMFTEGRHIPQGPLLQQNEQADLQGMRDNEDRILHGAGWVERKDDHTGVVHLPIDRAIDLVAEKVSKTKALPYWPAPANQPAQPAQPEPPTQQPLPATSSEKVSG